MPAIRVGNQPYGVLPITAYSKWYGRMQTQFLKATTSLEFFQESWRRKLGNVKRQVKGQTIGNKIFLIFWVYNQDQWSTITD
ncbi:MAG: hypothetical protein IPI90_19560 [Saprospiraceae bacterium]|nr:hypothetical protein [Candidatus Vicinibacter affinis]